MILRCLDSSIDVLAYRDDLYKINVIDFRERMLIVSTERAEAQLTLFLTFTCSLASLSRSGARYVLSRDSSLESESARAILSSTLPMRLSSLASEDSLEGIAVAILKESQKSSNHCSTGGYEKSKERTEIERD